MKSAWRLSAFLLMAAFQVLSGEPGAGKPQPAVEIVTKEEAKEITAVIDAVVAAGYPDAAKATLYKGKLSVSADVGPNDPPPLPTSASNVQQTNPGSNKTTYGFQFNGLHAKLADGSWLIALAHRFKPKAGDSVNTGEATEVKIADLTKLAAAAHPFNAEKVGGKWLDVLDPAFRPRAAAAMNLFLPVTYYLKLRPDDFAPALVLLYRAGWSDAGSAVVSVADNRSRQFWQLRPWMSPEAPYDPTGEYTKFKAEGEEWAKANPIFKPEPVAVALRRALFRWCRAQLTAESPEDTMMTPEVAAAAMKAMLDSKDPQGNAAKVDVMLAGAKLPVTPPEKAGIAERLQSWEARPRMPRMVVSGGGNAKKDGSVSMSTGFVAPKSAYEPNKKDLDELIELLGDERPSRFFDFNGPRTVGDNAFRAVAILLKSDPRTIVGYPTDKPWTAAERKAAAVAVQKWWKEHKKEYLDK